MSRREYQKAYRQSHKLELAEYQIVWQKTNRERCRQYNKAYYEANKEQVSAAGKEYYKNNKTKVNKKVSERYEANKQARNLQIREYQITNRDKYNALASKRRAAQLFRTPKWLSKSQQKEIEYFYSLAKELQWLSNPTDPLTVDHIIPLQGKNVSGLHVPWNLQILPRAVNSRKFNKC